jgi:hypothetical protein
MCGRKHAGVGQAFQPAGEVDFPVRWIQACGDSKVATTGRLESPPYNRTHHRTNDPDHPPAKNPMKTTLTLLRLLRTAKPRSGAGVSPALLSRSLANPQQRASNAQHPMTVPLASVESSMLDVGCSEFGFRPSFGSRISGFGFLAPNRDSLKRSRNLLLSLFCLLTTIPLARGTPPAADRVQDKPNNLYVLSDTLFKDFYSDSVAGDNDGGFVEGQLWHHNDYQWQEAVGGNGTRQDVQQEDDGDGSGWTLSWTNRSSSVLVWGTNGVGTDTCTLNDNLPMTYPIGLPLLTSEHCWVNDPQSPPFTFQDLGDGNWVTNQVYEEYVRHAQTRWRLQTGGREARCSLFRFSATASRIRDKRAERPFFNANSQDIPPQNITVLGQSLYPDTNLWLVLPDATNLDATPFVAGVDFYRMDVTGQKYIPLITVNDQELNAGTPEFCAGQQLDFALVFDPPPEYVSQMSVWDLSGPPVNDTWRASPGGSLNYWFNPDHLNNLTTSCWYPSGGDHTAGVVTWWQFANGQCCSLDVQGDFCIAKPSISGFANGASFTGFAWSSPVLQANWQWSVTVESAYDGSVGVTQLINGTNLCCNTGGGFRLDGTNELYSATPTNLAAQTYSATNSATHTASFLYARSATASPAADLAASFQDYLRFRPAGSAGNIWVTLGTNTWSMDGSASLSAGLTRSNLPPAAPLGESDEFPSWTDTFEP